MGRLCSPVVCLEVVHADVSEKSRLFIASMFACARFSSSATIARVVGCSLLDGDVFRIPRLVRMGCERADGASRQSHQILNPEVRVRAVWLAVLQTNMEVEGLTQWASIYGALPRTLFGPLSETTSNAVPAFNDSFSSNSPAVRQDKHFTQTTMDETATPTPMLQVFATPELSDYIFSFILSGIHDLTVSRTALLLLEFRGSSLTIQHRTSKTQDQSKPTPTPSS